MKKGWGRPLMVISLLSAWVLSGMGATPPPPDRLTQAATLLAAALPSAWAVQEVTVTGEALTVCLTLPLATLTAEGGLGAEQAQETILQAVQTLPWQSLSVQAVDPATGECLPLSDFLPAAISPRSSAVSLQPVAPAGQPTGALTGKTIYLSAGHGWQWNGYNWRTQRPVYQGFIEDHNNAEAVTQYLIPYLEQAGATVIPVRERDWNTNRISVDNGAPEYLESGTWQTGTQTTGYGGDYRFAVTVDGAATASVTWTLTAPTTARYALYAWNVPGSNRAADAHYTVHHAGGVTEVRLDQRLRPVTWRYLGTFPLYAGPVTVTLDNASATAGAVVIADALRLGGGTFDNLSGISTEAPRPPFKPWWESATYYFSQWVGLNPADWPYFNDVVARPMFSRWNHRGVNEDALYISWHTNGSSGTTRGTVSYVHNGDTYPRTEGSLQLQAAVHTELIHDLRAGWDAAWTDLGKRAANLGEVRMLWDDDPAVRMPGVLLEIAYHDQADDADALKDPRFNQLAARAVYQGIVHYFEQRDGITLTELPEPPTHLRVQNLGNGQVRVAWEPSPTDGVGLAGDPATAYRLYTSPDGFAWSAPLPVTGTAVTLSGLTPGQTLYVRVTGVNAGGESFPTEVLGARVGEAALLIVNGYDKLNRYGLVSETDPVEGTNLRLWLDRINRFAYVVSHGQAVPAQYAWDSASNEAVMSGAVDLQAYAMVDWLLGRESTEVDGTLNSRERAALADYLAQGGALLISGTELAWDLEATGRAPAFLNNTLRTRYIADDAQTYTVQPVSGGALAGLASFTFDAPGEYDADYPDVLAPLAEAQSALIYVGGMGGTAAVQSANGCTRLLVFGFPLEVIRPDARPAVMARALDFLDECLVTTPETQITSPAAGSYTNTAPAFTGWATGQELQRVEVQVQREDGAGWEGSSWGIPLWLTATGVTVWSYPLPALAEGSYTLTARAVGSLSDPTPAWLTFTVDTTPPLAPTLITPTGGITLTAMRVPLHWAAPPDAGSPLTYQVLVGGITRTATTTVLTVALGAGSYLWQVQAQDAAGNVGPWSAEERFGIDQQKIYLPLVLRNWQAEPVAPSCWWVLDDGFEAPETWTYNQRAVRATDIVRSGDWAARMGLVTGETPAAVYSSISRVIVLPTTATTLTLRYWFYPVATGSDPGDKHYLTLKNEAGQIVEQILTPITNSPAWEERTLDLSHLDLPGNQVTLFLGVINNATAPIAALYIDDVQIEACSATLR